MGMSLDTKQEMPLEENWLCYSLNHNNPSKDIPIILIVRGPKNITDVKKSLKNFDACIVFFAEKNALLLKTVDQSYSTTLESESEFERIISIVKSNNVAGAKDGFSMMLAIQNLINTIPNATGDFDNRGLFATNYLRNKIFEDTRMDVDGEAARFHSHVSKKPKDMLELLGWNMANKNSYGDKVSITVTEQNDFSIRMGGGGQRCCSELCCCFHTPQLTMGNPDKRKKVEAVLQQDICLHYKLLRDKSRSRPPLHNKIPRCTV